MSKGIFFQGRNIVHPGAYSYIDASAMVPNRLGANNRIGVIGTALGGVPQVVTPISSPQEALLQLRGGTLLDIIQLMYNPSPDMPGAGDISYYRLNLAVRAALTLKDGGAADVLTLTATDYGVWTNQIRVKIEAGSVSDKKISINDVTKPSIVEVGDNLGPCFAIQYIGALFAARMTITKTGDLATGLLLETQASSGTDPWDTLVNVDLTNTGLATMGQLVAYLASIADITCTLSGDQNEPVSDLDAVANQAIKAASYTAKALIGAIVYWVNSNSQLATAARVPAAVNVPANVAYTFFSGGAEGAAPDNTAWQNAIDAFQNEDVRYLFVCSDSATIHAMVAAHNNNLSDVKNRRERRSFVGGAAGETVAQAKARAAGLAGMRTQLAYPGIKRRNLVTGKIDTLSPMYFAALLCGIKAGANPEISLTYKFVNAIGLETVLTLTEIESLLIGGVTTVEPAPQGGFRIVQDITTYLVDDNAMWRKGFGVDIADYLNRQLRDATERFTGKVGDQNTVHSILNAAASRLRQMTRTTGNLTGVLTAGVDPDTGKPEPAFKNLRAVFDGTELVALTWQGHPVGEVGYVTFVGSLTPTTIIAS